MKQTTDHPSATHRRIRLAWYEPILPHYRVPVINRVAAAESLELTVFADRKAQASTSADATEKIDAPVVEVRYAPLHRVRLPLAYTYGWTRILRPHNDVVIVTEATRNLVNWLVLLLKRPLGYRVVIMGHIRLTPLDGRLLSRLRRRLVTVADGVIAYTEAGVQQAVGWGMPASAVTSMGNTIDVGRIARARELVTQDTVETLRKSFGLNGPTFLFIARQKPWKRLDVAIDAVRLLRDRGVRAHLLVVGSGSGYESRAADLDTVHFLGAITDEESLAPIFAASDLVLIPGAVGLAVNHAFAYGLPLVSSHGARHGPEMELAQHGRNTWLVDECDAGRFAEALQGLIEEPDRLAHLREGAVATNVPTIETMAERIVTLVERVAQRGHRR